MSAGEDAALLQVNLLRETWCRLEAEPRGSGRSGSQRRHFRAHLQTSPVLLDALTGREQRRWAAGRPAPPPGPLPERRHFDESRESHLA
ncbi:spermatogenesis-associated protein 45 [Nelusetta ayraudi]|uniref:spermatogenesis-associated protein 45 n=1 Tax=Nelusetta ayraudi TaxID=303726 RepID=UPI003F6F762F